MDELKVGFKPLLPNGLGRSIFIFATILAISKLLEAEIQLAFDSLKNALSTSGIRAFSATRTVV